MKRRLQKQRARYERGKIVRLDRSPEIKDMIDGYVVGESDAFIMLHALDSNYINLNGYTLLRRGDVRRYRFRDDYESFLHRALKLKGISPVTIPELDLNTFQSLFATAGDYFPLLTIHREAMDEHTCFIGKIEAVTEKTVTLQEIDPAARWSRTRRYNFRDITRVDFGDAYAEALLMVAAALAKTPLRDRRRLSAPSATR